MEYHRRVRSPPALALAARSIAIVVLVAPPRSARANDSEAVLAGGVLSFKKSDGIAMESEALTITPYKVEVAYLFRNTTAADITTRVAFPMAPYDNNGEDLGDVRDPEWHRFGKFSVVADGKSVEFETTTTFDAKREFATVTHHWMQTFPAGRSVSIKHQFMPAGSFLYDFGSPETERADALARDYCVGPGLIKAMKKRGMGTVQQVHYILKTGANWKGPIGRFVLRIVKDRPAQKSSVCMDGFRKVDARTFVLEKTNFVPTADLKIAFINLGD